MGFIARAGLLVLLVIWTAKFSFARAPDLIMDAPLHLVNLVFHEAGHVLFSPLGRFMTALGGSLAQVIVPVVCAVALAIQARDRFGAAVAAWWAGQNFIDLAPYIGDARTLQLPLLGGATGAEVEGHDWEAILSMLGWLHYDRALASGAHGVGVVVMLAALGFAAWTLLASRPAARPDDAPAAAGR